MPCQRELTALFTVFVSFAALPLCADPSQKPPRVERGQEVPAFHRVAAFFESAAQHYSDRGTEREAWYLHYLKKLEIERGSEQERAFVRAILLFELLQNETWVDLRPYQNDPVTFRQVQRDSTRRQVKELRKIWTDLQAHLRNTGHPVQPLYEQIERLDISLTTYGEPDPEMDAIVGAFSQGSGD